jgi:hypothetical protein
MVAPSYAGRFCFTKLVRRGAPDKPTVHYKASLPDAEGNWFVKKACLTQRAAILPILPVGSKMTAAFR